MISRFLSLVSSESGGASNINEWGFGEKTRGPDLLLDVTESGDDCNLLLIHNEENLWPKDSRDQHTDN
jgi:hypothetical protein